MTSRAGSAVRRVAVAVSVLSALCAPQSAPAGTYQVKACFEVPGQGWAGNGSWVPEAPGPFATAETRCPGDGIVSRMSGGPGTAPYGAGARHALTAPPGTRIVHFSASVNVNESRGWYAGVVDNTPRWVWCGIGTCSSWGTYVPLDVTVDTPRLFTQVVCGIGTCRRDGLYGLMAMRNAVVTIADDTLPSLAITGGSVTAPGWHSGDQDVQFAASDSTGIREVKSFVDGDERTRFTGDCSDVRTRPCGDATARLLLVAEAFRFDGRHLVTLRAEDGGGNVVTTEREVLVDRTPPPQPTALSLAGSDGWRSTNRFAVAWANPLQSAAPIAAAGYELCPAAGQPDAGRGCVTGARYERLIHGIDDLQAPAAGEWELRLWLADAAGNADRERSARLTGLRFDDTPPTLAFLDERDTDPGRVRVAASDRPSGIAHAQIEVRRHGEDLWRPIAADLDAVGFTAVLDDEILPDGAYDIRARAVDRAGNERSTESRPDGRPATLTLPVRIRTRVVAGKVKRVRARRAHGRHRYRSILVDRPRARFGRTIRLHGRLTTPGANPLAGVDVEVRERVKLPAAGWRRIGTVRTSRKGRFAFKALRGPGRLLRFRYPGTPTIRPGTAEVDLRVRAASSLAVSRHAVVNGEDVTFRGRLEGGPIPSVGKLVQLQAFARGRWLTFATPRANARTGGWHHPYRFAATRGRVRYRFRVRVPREAGYPYEAGVSRSVGVVVQGL